MDHRVVWSPAALDDLDAIAAYIARDSTVRICRRQQISRKRPPPAPVSPLRRIVSELGDERYREKIIYGWRMIYRFEDEVVTIASIVHSRQSFETGVGRLKRT